MGDQTQCTVIKYRQLSESYQQTMDVIAVTAVPDEEYYGSQNRRGGAMHPTDELRISDDQDWLKPGLSE